MRDIKFRVWDKINSKIVVNLELGDKRWTNRATEWFNIMQYTGLKDKNGIEIYEGDIVNDSAKSCVPVEWSSEKAGFVVTRGDFQMQIAQSLTSYWEVIGNIYSNPELLGGNHDS